MTPHITFDIFTSDLLPTERIEWTGQPEPRIIFHHEDWLVVPFSLMWGGFAIFWLVSASGVLGGFNHPNRTFEYFGIIWGTPFVFVGQYLIWGRFLYARWKKRRTYYALTNKRALIVVSGFRGRSSSSTYFENLSLIDKRVRSDGNGIISFGGPVTAEWQWGNGKPPRPPTFDDIDNADTVYQIANRLLDQARKGTQEAVSRWSQ